MAATSCVVPLAVLTADPYFLTVDQDVNIKVSATNAYGTSEYSQVGSGAFIQFVPDAPVSLLNLAEVTDATRIGISWSDGPENGGTEVIDYKVVYDQSTGQWIELEQGLDTATYTTAVPLVEGSTYSFKVLARNSVGLSSESLPISILVA